MGLFKKKITIINKDGSEDTFVINRKEDITADTLEELSNNRGDEDVE